MKPSASPDFLGIGAPRAGTTWLWTVLRAHPQIWMPPRKEMHYFDRAEKYPTARHLQHDRLASRMFRFDRSGRKWWRVLATDIYYLLIGKNKPSEIPWLMRYHFGHIGDPWYLSLFDGQPGHVRGEITPAYCLLDDSDVSHVHNALPDIKLLYTLRDPVERAWSQIRFGMGRRGLTVNEDALAEIERRAGTLSQKLTSDYAGTIQRWRAFYPAERMFILFQDQIEDSPEILVHEVYTFLGVDASFQPAAGLLRRRVNASAESDMPVLVRKLLIERHRHMVEELNRMIGGITSKWLESYRDF